MDDEERKLLDQIRELKSSCAKVISALVDLRALTKASAARTTEAGSSHFVLFKLPKDGALRTRGIAVLEKVDGILARQEAA